MGLSYWFFDSILEKNDFTGCVYNSPVYIKENIPLMITIYVLEMNNDMNKIRCMYTSN